MGLLTTGWITGLKAEARWLTGLVAIGGGMPAGAAEAAERLVAQGATALISFGLAGGLDPSLPPGTVIIPSEVIDTSGTYRTDPTLTATLGGPTHTSLAAGQSILATAHQKSRLFAATHAAAVDLETGEVARVATTHNLPFAALRAICDPATSDLPPAALAALDAHGAIGLWRITASLLRTPSQLPALLALARDAAAARRALHTALTSAHLTKR